jgi:hypothetical protein
VADADGWDSLADYLRSPEFATLAGRVESITIVNREAEW